MILKSFLIEKNLSIIDQLQSILFYGENFGLKDEIKSELKKNLKIMKKLTFKSRRNYKK